jgi:hypothetical protein
MWRDANAFNELGIPALSYGPRSASHASSKSFKIDDFDGGKFCPITSVNKRV